MTKPKVKILLAVPDEKSFGPCTMVLDTFRVGFPTAEVEVYCNLMGDFDLVKKVGQKIWDRGLPGTLLTARPLHHYEWVAQMIRLHDDSGPLVLLDGDVCFHKSCEDWHFDTHLAGYCVPSHWSDAAGCRSLTRLHTSHMWITDTKGMMQKVRDRFPHSFEPLGHYCPIDIVTPAIKVVDGEPFFWDTACVAYQLLGGSHFSDSALSCFNHLGSATAVGAMRAKLEAKGENLWLHERGYQDLDWIKQNLWTVHNNYYVTKQTPIIA